MWTPKRVVLLTLCFVAVFAAYLGYAYSSVGGIDGLPPLPEIYWPGPGGGVTDPASRPSRSMLLATIRMAFGHDCPELDKPVRLVLPGKNMVLTADSFELGKDGRVALHKISLATFKDRDGQYPEITTLRAGVAWLTFDRPVNSFSEIPYRKIVEAELNGDASRQIEVRNNRSRKDRDEDLHVHVPVGPVYYREDTHRIWTNSVVHVYDHRSKPQPHTVTGKGMTMELLTETPPDRTGSRKPQREAITGLKWIELHSGVKVVIHLEGNNGFLGGDQNRKPATPPAAKGPKGGERTELTITTPGKFRYEIHKTFDRAHFAAHVATSPNSPPQVSVIRKHPGDKLDQLLCQDLTLQLRRRDAADKTPKKSSEPKGEGLEIETALATSSGPGRDVTLTSDVDGIVITEANYFFYDAMKQLTTIKAPYGPVKVTYKDDTKIHAPELEIQDVKPPTPPNWKAGQPLPPTSRPYQKIKAKGPGSVVLVEKPDLSTRRIVRAEWSELLTSDREGLQDVLTLTGSAKFIDEQARQSLQAESLKVWLDPPEEVKSQLVAGSGSGAPPSLTGSRKAREVLAIGNVMGRSKELNIHDTGKLLVKFTDVPSAKHLPPGGVLPPEKKVDKRPTATVPSKEVAPREPKAMPEGPEKGPVVTATPASRQGDAGPVLAAPEEPPPQRPFDLSARYVEAKVERSPIKNVVDELWCQGQVKVKQEPAKGEEKPTKIDGEKLEMTALAEGGGYHLKVLAGEGANDLAELATDRIWICGPEINIHQGWNKSWVVGEGAMQMESATNFQGEKLKKPVPMSVTWTKSMLFNGITAEFLGDVQANQQTVSHREGAAKASATSAEQPVQQTDARLAAQHLVVSFDRMISLKEGNRSDQPARVRKLVCDQDVRVEEVVSDLKLDRKVVKYQALFATVMHVDSLEPDDEKLKGPVRNRVVAYGPGTYRVWELGTASETKLKSAGGAAASAGSPPQAKQEFKMTVVSFAGLMQANSQTNTVSFWRNVQVLSLPWPKYDVAVDVEKVLMQNPLPEGALYLRCDRVKVLDTPADPKTKRPANKEMEGHGSVFVQGKEFSAHADVVKYNQLKQQVILMGTKEAPARMLVQRHPGAPWQTATGKTITYYRSRGETTVDGADQVIGETAPAPAPASPQGPKKK